MCGQSDAASLHAQFGRVPDALAGKLPSVTARLDASRSDVLALLTLRTSGSQLHPWEEAAFRKSTRAMMTLCLRVPTVWMPGDT